MVDTPEQMERKSSGRSPSAGPTKGQSQDGNKSGKQENGKGRGNTGPKYDRKREPNYGSRPRPGGLGQGRRPQTQKTKPFDRSFDKRPRSRCNTSDYNPGRCDEVAKESEAEVGSALQKGSRKMNLNHLLNFTYERRENASQYGGGQHTSWKSRNKWGRKGRATHPFNKEQFLQSNCQFVVRDTGDYTVHSADPDTLVDWSSIEQVRLFSNEVPSCPICLYPPTAAKITRCGHIYCWPCILHYLALSDKSWRKCPICYDAVHKADLKSVVAMAAPQYAVGGTITMRLMKRERGSVVALPVSQWKQQADKGTQPFNIDDEVDTRFVKLLVASSDQVHKQIIGPEKAMLQDQLEKEKDCPEACFIEAALKSLTEREEKIVTETQVGQLAAAAAGLSTEEGGQVEDSQEDKPPENTWQATKPTVEYASAFSDEEMENPDLAEAPLSPIAVEGVLEPAGEAPLSPTAVEGILNPAEEPTALSEFQNQDVLDQSVNEKEESEEITASSDAPSCQGATAGHEATSLPYGAKNFFYFYQADDGQHLYLYSLNIKCLVKEYGSLENCPEIISGKIVEIDQEFTTEDVRRRLRYLSHLPLTCEFSVCELALKPPLVSRATLRFFDDEIQKRKQARAKRHRQEQRRDRRISEEESKKMLGKYPDLRSALESRHEFPEWRNPLYPQNREPELSQSPGSASSSSVQTPIGSPGSNLNPAAVEFVPGAAGAAAAAEAAPEDTSPFYPPPPSFAQMLRSGQAKPEVWPRAAVAKEQKVEPVRKSRSSADSEDDEPGEDWVPAPTYQNSFSEAIAQALGNLDGSAEASTEAQTSGGKKKKNKNKKKLLFSTSVIHYK
ncbi:PREDICTED: RING finger protein 10-like isoform X1 [Branchiostoma belcheri]|uniref:E3 ubiquitin-protein ligase RNF10 n=1 Tax=Branchiostoma belcheri TaxID=7741 RepID=A0A6P4YEK2_BRABE|nr:PREDICTED: RING finger protein 10-like isoform X1 [Branchiostoma belcheri]